MTRHRNPLRTYYVVTPPYEYVDVIEDGWGPISLERDVIEVQAHTKREAIILGVRRMKAEPGYHYHRRHCDGNPFTGVKAYLYEEDEECTQTGN